MRSLSLVVSECSLSGPGQSHVSNGTVRDLTFTNGRMEQRTE